MVVIPEDYSPLRFYRLLRGLDAAPSEFLSNQNLEKLRIWNRGSYRESVVDYRGISSFDSFERAFGVERALRRKDRPRRWQAVAEFAVDGHEGEAYARTHSEGHFTIWAEPEGLASRVTEVRPIPE